VAERVKLVRASDPDPVDIRLNNGETVRFKSTVLPEGGRMFSYTPVSDLVRRADVGDRVITRITDICRDGQRASDVVARIGGEEFVMLPETPLESALLVADRLRRRIADTPLLDAIARVALTVSIGVAEAGSRTENVAALLKDADDALYRAKNAGRDRVETATTEAPAAPIALAS
jgi:predicted signal transduction protein with EAL and GGDEF domain